MSGLTFHALIAPAVVATAVVAIGISSEAHSTSQGAAVEPQVVPQATADSETRQLLAKTSELLRKHDDELSDLKKSLRESTRCEQIQAPASLKPASTATPVTGASRSPKGTSFKRAPSSGMERLLGPRTVPVPKS